MAVASVTEISATSAQSFEDAIRQGLERATRTLRGVTAAWIKDQRVKLEDGKVAEYQVNMDDLRPRGLSPPNSAGERPARGGGCGSLRWRCAA